MNSGSLIFVAALILGPLGACVGLLSRRPGWAHVCGMVAAVLSATLALIAGALGLAGSSWSLQTRWAVPLGSFHLGMDPLSAFFVGGIAVVSLAAAIYGYGYLKDAVGRRSLGWLAFNGLISSMCLVVTARNGVLLLMAWEMMSLTSFFLVITEHQRPQVLQAGWIYLAATHLGTACLLALFVLLGGDSLDFESLTPSSPIVAGWAFVLALIGFGTKAGLVPMHVWLPQAHPVAPSHVSAVMSGVMVKTGLYGLIRIVTLLGHPAPWWGWTLIAIGVVSALFGVIMSLAQHDLKRLLAYCTVENVGVIVLGLGLGLLGLSHGHTTWAALALGGALLHVLNHALFKGLLFMGAGRVLHVTGTLEMDRLGGLLKRLPVIGATFLIGAAAIVGLPPFNGFVSELLIYLAGLTAWVSPGTSWMPWAGVTVIGTLALAGGLAVIGLTRAVGSVFLGMPRDEKLIGPIHPSRSMTWPLILLAGLCLGLGLMAPVCWKWVTPVVTVLTGTSVEMPVTIDHVLIAISCLGVTLVCLTLLLIGLRLRLLRHRNVCSASTWDCGYLHANTRMQYSGSSLVDPLLSLFQSVLRTRRAGGKPLGLFPTSASLQTETPDHLLERGYRPLFAAVARLAGGLRRLQQGRNQLYILYIAVTVLVLLLWKLR